MQTVKLATLEPIVCVRIQPKLRRNGQHPYSTIQICIIDQNEQASLSCLYPQSTQEYHVRIPCVVEDVKSLWISPLDGEWEIEHVDVFDVDTQRNHVFTPSVQEYSTCCFVPVQQISEESRLAYLQEYKERKDRILTYSTLLSVLGCATLSVSFDVTKGVPFALGGFIGTVYQLLLQQEVDQIGKEHSDIFTRAISNPIIRWLILYALGAYGIKHSTSEELLLGIVGFLTYKVAIIGAYLKK